MPSRHSKHCAPAVCESTAHAAPISTQATGPGAPVAARPADGHPLQRHRALPFRRRRAPPAGVRPGRASPARPTRSAGSALCSWRVFPRKTRSRKDPVPERPRPLLKPAVATFSGILRDPLRPAREPQPALDFPPTARPPRRCPQLVPGDRVPRPRRQALAV